MERFQFSKTSKTSDSRILSVSSSLTLTGLSGGGLFDIRQLNKVKWVSLGELHHKLHQTLQRNHLFIAFLVDLFSK